ncbi:MAG: hypothetical protein KC431_03145 [Myxococcales bacterium]|nr:hypothetical protein [Myxococcales bacterium]
MNELTVLVDGAPAPTVAPEREFEALGEGVGDHDIAHGVIGDTDALGTLPKGLLGTRGASSVGLDLQYIASR